MHFGVSCDKEFRYVVKADVIGSGYVRSWLQTPRKNDPGEI